MQADFVGPAAQIASLSGEGEGEKRKCSEAGWQKAQVKDQCAIQICAGNMIIPMKVGEHLKEYRKILKVIFSN